MSPGFPGKRRMGEGIGGLVGGRMMRGLRDKGVLISGGTSGIGLASAERFLEEGCRVFVAGLGTREVDAAVGMLAQRGWVSGRVSAMACDVSVPADVARLVEAAEDALGGVDVLINNAGTARRDPFLDIALADWDQILAVNLRGMFLVAQAVSKRMAERGCGVVVNMASINAMAGEEDYAHYNASKGGVLQLTRTMAAELGRRGIRVNAVCPGYIRTPLNDAISAQLGAEQFEAGYVASRIPLGRVGRADEVASAYAFLASDDASFVHGAALVIDGGQLAMM
jgi:NAD(P)-dependent dehydrogenase (short-subunit alcohol dehydrogenase family)